MTYKTGDIIESKEYNTKRKILGEICGGLAYWVSEGNNLDELDEYITREYIDDAYIVVKQKFVPKVGDLYHYLTSGGEIKVTTWVNEKDDNFRLSTGNIFENEAELELYKAKLLELGK